MGSRSRRAARAAEDGRNEGSAATNATSKPLEMWPACNPEIRTLASLIPYARNSRTHDEQQVAEIAASMLEWGFTNPVLVDEDGGVIAGHGRILAARLLRDSGHPQFDNVPTIVARGWTDAQKQAYVIADNALPLRAGWNVDMLKAELLDLEDAGFNLKLLALDEEFVADIFGANGEGEGEEESTPRVSLSDRFGVPPFSVLNAREGWWQDRKRAWLALGIASEIGRGAPSRSGAS